MDKTPPSRYQRFLRWAAARRLVIPRDTRVDPSLLSEERFPVSCPKCEYLLRGLPDGRCPECGREFDHGKLLVEQYVGEAGKRSHPVTSKWTFRMWLAGALLLVCGGMLPSLMQWVEQRAAGLRQTPGSDRLLRACVFTMIGAQLVGLSLLAVAFVLDLRLAIVSRRKRRQILDAIDRNQPGFVEAQRAIWVTPALLLGLGAAFGTWYLLLPVFGQSGTAMHPLHLVLSIVIGCGTTIGIVLAAGCVRGRK
ncbi:MAG TPA: hypothetical protein PLL20_11690 [Phycisphaerae bacterium]|nr:hypothetical protein [Phycisphaerae bacterium]HRR86384.1 hypothetical protein [Phycisphaerae bacterium]